MSETQTQEIPDVTIAYRLIEDDDLRFIIDSWMKSYRNRIPLQGSAPNCYYKGQLALIQYLSRYTHIMVACDANEPRYIIGWACALVDEDNVFNLHYIYVKDDYRRHGIANSLVTRLGYRQGRPIIASHWNKVARYYAHDHGTLFYNPYLITLGRKYV